MHHVFAVTSEGQYVLKLVQNSHKLIPYAMIRPILKVGNAATMLNSLMKLLLAKLSLGSLSNWAGLTQKADEGMNLLQRYGIPTPLSAGPTRDWRPITLSVDV